MRIGGIYSFKGGQKKIETDYTAELAEIEAIIASISAVNCQWSTVDN